MAKEKLKMGLAKRKPRSMEEQIASLKNYIRALDPPREPETAGTRNSIHKDGFVPSWVWVQMLRIAEARGVRREARRQAEGLRREARGERGKSLWIWLRGIFNSAIRNRKSEISGGVHVA